MFIVAFKMARNNSLEPIDDLTMCLEDPSQLDQLMSELRQRFTIKEGEGQPVDWLLGMRIHQNVEEGYLSMDQELAITKLAKVILDLHIC